MRDRRAASDVSIETETDEMRNLGWTMIAFATIGCTEPPLVRDQWHVTLGTDLPVPQLGDGVLVEVLESADGELVACPDCRRQLAGPSPERWPLSFAVAPREDGGDLWLRARLFRGRTVDEFGVPRPELSVDLLAALPPALGVTEVFGNLASTCLGQVADVVGRTGCHDAQAGFGAAVLSETTVVAEPGSWEPARRVNCAGSPPHPGMRCVPGGLLILGSERYLPASDPDRRPLPERLVQLSPFWMDEDEVTAGELAEAVAAGEVAAPTPGMHCTYGGDPSLPANCISQAAAEAVCARRGASLPTEAQWEYVASDVGREADFPFAAVLDTPRAICQHAIVGVAFGVEGNRSCVERLGTGLRAGGSPFDVNQLGIKNLAGHVSEWVKDDFAPYANVACWGEGPSVLVDPECVTQDGRVSVRGGHWMGSGVRSRASSRGFAGALETSPSIGFRCVAFASPASSETP